MAGKKRLGRWMGAVALVAAVGVSGIAGVALAQQATGPDGLEANAPEDTSQYLGPIYKDNVAGFQIAPPAGSRIINRAGIDLVSFVNDAKQWGGSVQTVNMMTLAASEQSLAGGRGKAGATGASESVDDYMRTVAPELSKTFRAVQVLNMRDLKFHGREAGRIDTSMEAAVGKTGSETVAIYRQQLIVRTSPTDLLVVTLYTPLKDRDAATTTFNAMLTTFDLVDRNKLAKEMGAAVQNAKDWLKDRTADELKAKLLNQPQLFRIKVAGKDVGYMRFEEREDAREHTKGVLVDINTRTFPPDGSVVLGHNSAYWAYSGNAAPDMRRMLSMWEITTESILNRPNVPKKQRTFWISEFGTLQLAGLTSFSPEELKEMQAHRDQLIRENAQNVPPPIPVPEKHYEIQVTFSGDSTQERKPPLEMSIPLQKPDGSIVPTVLPPVLGYLWPRVVDLTKPTAMTFLVYNSALHKATYRTLSVIGPDHVVINKKPVDCIRCLDEMEPNSTTMWVDSSGKVLMMRTSDETVLVPTTQEEMERMWGGRMKQ